MENNKGKIKYLYFVKSMKVVDIAKELGISKQRVSKILNTKYKEEFEKEKEIRKRENKEKRNMTKALKNRERRKMFAGDITVEDLRKQQESSARYLSQRAHMSNESVVYSNLNAYISNGQKLIYNPAVGKRPADLPSSFSLYIKY